MKALAKNPDDRYQNAADFLVALTHISLDEAATLHTLAIQPSASSSPSDGAQATFRHRRSGKPGSLTPKSSTSAIDPSILDSVSRELAAFIGPIAKVVVKRAAGRCSSVDELYSAVAAEIDSDKDRSCFMASKKRRV